MLLRISLKSPDTEAMLMHLLLSGWIIAQTSEDAADLVYSRKISRC